MATPEQTPYNTYLGNGVTTEFSIGFNYTDTGSVKVYIKRSEGEEELLPDTDYSFVNETTLKFPAVGSSETVLADGDVLTIQRETAVENDFVFSNQKRLFPEDVMEADDNEMRILQEHARQLGRALVLPPTSQIDPEDVIGQVERVYDSIDNIDTVADSISDVNNVSDNMTKVSDVSSNMTSVSGVYSNMSKITSVYNNRTNITAVANNSTNINTVAGDKANIDAVANNSTNINAVAGNATNINAVNANKTNIDTVAGDKTNIDKVANKISQVNTVASNISNVNTVATNDSNITTCATNINAINSAPTCAANAAASAELSAQYANDKINQTHITNCLTEIPQDIKLELSSGTLTLKAGSKLYIPNGSGTFSAVTTTTDRTYSYTTNGKWLIICAQNGTMVRCNYPATSGSTQPSSPTVGELWYDTTNNYCKRWSGSSWENRSFPIAIVTVSDGAISSIDQVFNGFGYIGSSVFALPGIKGLKPNGRNSDGTLKSIYWTCNSVVVRTFPVSDNYTDVPLAFDGSSFYRILRTAYSYNQSKNYNYNNDYVWNTTVIGSIDETAGVVSNFNIKPAFHAVDYSEFKQADDNNVKIIGDQDIAGVKNFQNSVFTIQNYNVKSNFDSTVAPATYGELTIVELRDKNNVLNGSFRVVRETDGTIRAAIYAGNNGTNKAMSIAVDTNGNAITRAPTPPTGDNGNQIATTAWVWNFLKGISGYSASKTQTLKNVNGTFKWVDDS